MLNVFFERTDRYPCGEVLFDSGNNWVLEEKGSERIIKLFYPPGTRDSLSLYAVFDPDFSRGSIYVSRREPLPERIFPLLYPLDELILLHHATFEGGLLFHACGAELDGKGVLFPGHSGAGKSTVARILHENGAGSILSDDRIILRFPGGKPWIYGTPWHGEEEFNRNSALPLAGIFHLRQSPINHLAGISPSRNAALLFSALFTTYWKPRGIERTLAGMNRLVHLVPGYRMEFTPERTFIELVKRELS